MLYWEAILGRTGGRARCGLELGARNGGLSCFFASRFACDMACTDIEPVAKARALHERHGVASLMTYRQVDACDIPWPDASFDFVVFKSMLGVVGAHGKRHRQATAISEIHRVLRPGGFLLFAENLKGSPLHQVARKAFVPWGRSWAYVHLEELRALLAHFESAEVRSTGFLSAFVPQPEKLRSLCAVVDNSILRWLPERWNYVGYGHAVK